MVVIEDLTEINITHVFVDIPFPHIGAIGSSKQLQCFCGFGYSLSVSSSNPD